MPQPRKKTTAARARTKRVSAPRADEAWPGKPPPLDPWPGKREDDAWPGKPPPLDPWPGKHPEDFRSFVVDIDWSIALSDEAVRRIERQLKEAVFSEVAHLDHDNIIIRSIRYRGGNGVEVVAG
jgi:hypothetical protein